jgi:hypothetical protein
LAAILIANVLASTVLVIGTTSNADAGAASLTIWALLSSHTSQLALTCQTFFSVLQFGTSHFWRRVWLVSWWASTTVSVIFNGANS